MRCKSVVISGYATIDHVVRLPHALQGGGTYAVEALLPREWPRPGGAALYASRRIIAAGHTATALVVVGDDANGALYRKACADSGVAVTPIASAPALRTPWCLLAYHDDGGYTCLLDRGYSGALTIDTVALRHTVPEADVVCIAAAAPEVTSAVLDRAGSQSLVAWIAKNDPDCFPTPLVQRLTRRADFIFCNSSERPRIDAARATTQPRDGQVIIETRGAQGVVIEQTAMRAQVAVEPLEVRDATGAGDTLAGEVLAHLLHGAALEDAVTRGACAARELLAARCA